MTHNRGLTAVLAAVGVIVCVAAGHVLHQACVARADDTPEPTPSPAAQPVTSPRPATRSHVSPADASAEWPGWNGPHRDGRSPDTGLLRQWPPGGPELLWKNEEIGAGWSSPTVAGGAIYITGETGKRLFLFALGLDGVEKWKRDVGTLSDNPRGLRQVAHPGARSTPMYDAGKVYVLGGAGELVCVDAKFGAKVWSKNLIDDFGGKTFRWGYSETPLIYGDMLIVTPGGTSAMLALDKTSGRKIWATDFTVVPHQSSAIVATQGDQPVIINNSGGGLFAVNAMAGARLWSDDFGANNTANCNTPLVSGDLCFSATSWEAKGGVCLRLNADGSTARLWTTPDMNCEHGGYVLDNGYVYGNNWRDGWSCIELKTGKTRWKAAGFGRNNETSSILYADGMLYLYGQRGQVELAVCSPEKLERRGAFQVAGAGESYAHPVVIGGRLYLRYDKNLYCFDIHAARN